MRAQDVRIMILEKCGDKEFYGYDVQKKLKSEGVEVEFGRLYKILTSMLQEGLLDSHWEKSPKGPERKVYRLSARGKLELNRVLLNAIDLVRRYYNDYLQNLPPMINAFYALPLMLTDAMNKPCNITFVTARSSPTNDAILYSLQKSFPDCQINNIRPESENLDIKLKNKVSFDGEYDNVPLKDNSVDLLIVMGVPESKNLRKSMEEWCRVLKTTGRIAILVPNALLSYYKDPLTLGDFLEKWEFKILGRNSPADSTSVQGLLEDNFEKVEKKHALDLTVLLSSERRNTQKF